MGLQRRTNPGSRSSPPDLDRARRERTERRSRAAAAAIGAGSLLSLTAALMLPAASESAAAPLGTSVTATEVVDTLAGTEVR